MQWANDGGWTTEIIAVPSAEDWTWRVSVADVESAGPFSRFPEVDRTIALLVGSGFALQVDGAPAVRLETRFEPFCFDGAADTTCSLIDGPVQDLNLMVRRGSAPLRLDFVVVTERTAHALGPGVELVVVVAGAVELGGVVLDRFDAFRPGGQPCDVSLCADQSEAVLAVVSVVQDRR